MSYEEDAKLLPPWFFGTFPGTIYDEQSRTFTFTTDPPGVVFTMGMAAEIYARAVSSGVYVGIHASGPRRSPPTEGGGLHFSALVTRVTVNYDQLLPRC